MEFTNKTDIVEVVGHYLNLKPRGQNYIALCPFHQENTPSFSIHRKRNRWKCFGCGRGGDAIAFIQELKGVSFPQALDILGLKNEEDKFLKVVNPPVPKKLNCLPIELLRKSMKDYEQNCFVKWLHSLFEAELVEELINIYYVGTSFSFWSGSTVFWQVDVDLKPRQAKVILYNPETGKRRKWKEVEDATILSKVNQHWIKERKPDVIFVGKMLLKKRGIQNAELRQCFFGEHQLSNDTTSKIAIVESEKTAILMTAFHRLGLPIARDYIWLATGGKNGCSLTDPSVTAILEDRVVVLFPDLGAYEDWLAISSHLPTSQVLVSTILEEFATLIEKDQGLDIADFMLREYGTLTTKLSSSKKQKSLDAKGIEHVSKPIKLPTILSRQERILTDMVSQNPLINNLIQRFDLEFE